MAMSTLIMGFVTILIGVNLLPIVADTAQAAQFSWNGSVNHATNVTGAAGTITGLVTIFYALGVMAIGVQLAVVGMRESGMV